MTITIDGSSVSEVTIDGTQVQEITIDGSVVWTKIPDAGDLKAHYDFSQEDGSTPVTDRTGNGHDLSGTYSGVSVDINGVQAGAFDGVDDLLQTTFSAVSQPTTVFIVYELRSDDTGNKTFFDGGTQLEQAFFDDTQDGGYEIYAGSRIGGGGSKSVTVDDPDVMSGLFNGSSSIMRFDGTEDATGDPGTQSLSGVTLGGQADDTSHVNAKIGEVLVYPMDKSGIFSDVENHLIDKWGPV